MASVSAQVARFGSGKSVRRVEDEALLTGKGRFADDVDATGQVHLAFLRSPYPHARIAAIDTRAAAALPGVIAVVTGDDLVRAGVKPLVLSADFRRADGSPTATPPRHALAVDVVRHVGEAVAAIVAKSLREAQDAVEAIDVRYETLPMVVDPRTRSPAARRSCGRARPTTSRASFAMAAPTRPPRRFARPPTRCGSSSSTSASRRVRSSRARPSRAYDAATERLTLTVSCQTPTGLRDELCEAVLGIPKDQVRVVVGDVGGGFGMKTNLYPEDVVAAWCARKLRRPVKWCASRMDEFLAASHGRDVTSTAELALDASGRVLALRVDSLANVGAYATGGGVVIQLLIGPWVATSIYDIGTIDIRIRAVLTNTAPTGAYRGAGRPEAIYMIERLMDAAARATGIDQVELRRRNMIAPVADAVSQPARQDVRQRAIRLGDGPGARARRLERIRRAPRRREAPRPVARPWDGGVSRMDRCRRVRGNGHRHRRG